MPSYLSAYGREPWVLAMASIQPCKGGTALSPLQGSNTGMPRNPGLTPWALLSHPFGVAYPTELLPWILLFCPLGFQP